MSEDAPSRLGWSASASAGSRSSLWIRPLRGRPGASRGQRHCNSHGRWNRPLDRALESKCARQRGGITFLNCGYWCSTSWSLWSDAIDVSPVARLRHLNEIA